MAKKRAKKSDFDEELEGILDDTPESPPEEKKSLVPGYSYPGKSPKTSKKKRDDLNVQWNSDNRSKTLDDMMDGMKMAASGMIR